MPFLVHCFALDRHGTELCRNTMFLGHEGKDECHFKENGQQWLFDVLDCRPEGGNLAKSWGKKAFLVKPRGGSGLKSLED